MITNNVKQLFHQEEDFSLELTAWFNSWLASFCIPLSHFFVRFLWFCEVDVPDRIGESPIFLQYELKYSQLHFITWWQSKVWNSKCCKSTLIFSCCRVSSTCKQCFDFSRKIYIHRYKKLFWSVGLNQLSLIENTIC